MSTLGINTFLRIDQQIINDVVPHLIAVIPNNELHCYWLFNLDNSNANLLSWLKAQSKDAIGLGSINVSSMTLENVPNPKYVIVGISYSTLTADMLKVLSQKPNTRMTDVHDFKHLDYALKTRNPLLMWNRERKMYYYESSNPVYKPKLPDIILTDNETQFVNSLKGHDFFYEYSDSLSVYKAGKRREELLKADGVNIYKLTQGQVDFLYNRTMKELTNR